MGTGVVVGVVSLVASILGIFASAKKLSDKGVSISLDGIDTSNGVIAKDYASEATDALKAEKYQLDSVLTSESTQPYISSPEVSRPDSEKGDDSSKKKNTLFDNIKDKFGQTGSAFPFKLPDLGTVGTFYVGYKVGDVLGDVAETPEEKKKDWIALGLVLGGAFVAYKVFVK